MKLPLRLQQNNILELDHVGIVRENRAILTDVNLRVNEGDFVAITGPNGGGKTTMLRLILGLIQPTSGRIVYKTDGTVVKQLHVGYLPQKNMIDSHFPIDVRGVIASGLLGVNMKSDEKANRIEQTVALMGLEDHLHSPIGTLSGGQLQRALLGRAIISDPPVLVLDEPLSYIDKHFEDRMYRIISDLASHTTILLVSHEMSVIAGMANRHLIVDRDVHECTAAHHYVHITCDE
jgi:zinc transport system ATP-binding protein